MSTVLVVDDRAANREVARATLDHGGYLVLEASDGPQALTAARTHQPDLVVTDVLMPGMDGFQLVQQLRNDPDTAAIPVLFYTAHYNRDDAGPLAETMGVHTVLSKDTEPLELLDAVARALHDEPGPERPPVRIDLGSEYLHTVNAKLLEKTGELDESESLFHTMAEASPVGIVIGDRRGQAGYVNPRLAEILGTPAVELLGQGWLRCLTPEHRRALHTAAAFGLDPDVGDARYGERVALPDGTVRWLSVIVRVTRDRDGGVSGFVAMIDDTTAAIEADERRRAAEQARDEEFRRQASARFDSLSRMAGGVAHDFNNLLTVVMSCTELVGETLADQAGEPLTDECVRDLLEMMGRVYRAGERAALLTHQLLAFGGREVVEPTLVDLDAQLGEFRDSLVRTVGDQVAVRYESTPGLDRVRVDVHQFGQVLANLAANACDAMPDGGELRLATADVLVGPDDVATGLAPGRYVRLDVADTGHGMPPDVARRAMEPFFTTHSRAERTGLGLATAYGLIRQAGGELTIDSEVGRGTTVHLYLPVADQGPAPSRPRHTEAAPGGLTVLVAEDGEDLRILVVRLLTNAGYQVLAGEHGQEALDLAAAHDGPIHLLLSDVVMPVMNGRELAERMREVRPETPVLFMSGYAAPVMTEQGLLDAGGTVLGKPFTKATLLGAVGEMVAR